uniref:inorganic diphosphatase n=1 Tax=Dendroctonus ponderosae TaxID=77166 RepID=A0AAR5QGB0_DENPD
MSFKNVKAGINPPDDFNSIIEIPANAKPIKYEVNKEYDALLVDRFLNVFVIAPHAVAVGSVIRSRPVGVMYMEDEAGIDAKIIAVPHSKLTPLYNNVKDMSDLPQLQLDQMKHFFEHYKDLEK